MVVLILAEGDGGGGDGRSRRGGGGGDGTANGLEDENLGGFTTGMDGSWRWRRESNRVTNYCY